MHIYCLDSLKDLRGNSDVKRIFYVCLLQGKPPMFRFMPDKKQVLFKNLLVLQRICRCCCFLLMLCWSLLFFGVNLDSILFMQNLSPLFFLAEVVNIHVGALQVKVAKKLLRDDQGRTAARMFRGVPVFTARNLTIAMSTPSGVRWYVCSDKWLHNLRAFCLMFFYPEKWRKQLGLLIPPCYFDCICSYL